MSAPAHQRFVPAAEMSQPVNRLPHPRRRLRIGVLASCPFPANHGTPGSIREMSEALAQLGHEVHVVTYHFGENIPMRGLHVHRIRPLTGERQVVVGPTIRRPLYDFQMIFKTLQVLKRHRLDLIHAHGYEAALVAGCCKLVRRIPVIYSGHNTMADELASYDFIRPRIAANLLAKLLDAFVPRIGDRCIPHSRNINKFFRGMGLGGRTTPVIDFGIDLSAITGCAPIDIRREYGLGSGPIVAYAGVMDHFQRLDLLLEAMVPVVAGFPAAYLLMIVTIPNDKHASNIRLKAEELGISDRVVLTPPQPLNRIGGLLKSADVAVVSRPETPGFPIKLLNYMAAGCPCVMFESSSSGLVHRQHVYLAFPDTSAALAAGILEVLGDEELRRRLSAGGYQFVSEHNDRRITAQKVCEIYEELLRSRGRGRWAAPAAELLSAPP